MSWGLYPDHAQTSHQPEWRGEIQKSIVDLSRKYGPTLPYGNGRSYGDSCLAVSDRVIDMRKLNRFIHVDWKTGIITAESGVMLDEILRLAIPHGWFLPVTPGTQYITLGGAVANDVHGKNHHVQGTFGCHVRRFGLVRSDQTEMICSKDENSMFFRGTIGGLGLTGVITWIELQLLKIESSFIDQTTIRFNSLKEFFALSRELDVVHTYTVAWVDCLAKGAETGRGVYIVGNHSQKNSLELPKKRKINVPLTPPISLINSYSLRLFNTVFYHKHQVSPCRSIVDYDSFFYPLDGVLHWNRIYGRAGFQQYQCVIPDQEAEYAMRSLLEAIAQSGCGSFLAVLKRCGDIASPGLLSFPFQGTTLALDFPQHHDLHRLFLRMDGIVRESGGRLYPAKDAHMSSGDFQYFYPQWEELEALRDPAICSRFWQRVTLKTTVA